MGARIFNSMLPAQTKIVLNKNKIFCDAEYSTAVMK